MCLNSDCGTEGWSDNMVGNPYRFIIYWIIISKNIKKVTKVIDVKNWRVDNSRVSKWIVSLVEWNSSVSSMKSSIKSTFSIEKTNGSDAKMPLKEAEKENKAENGTKNKPIKSDEKELTQVEEEKVVEAPSSQPVGKGVCVE
nr:hypothetical protein [Tanacetum cinerariifolium]